ncbi:Pantothenic acid kinase [Hyphodiscus hymeniophilus]|uniref:Pantothenic acid kinase n=1 Tax=Hyphodiscus hymeniophilus TaxID=353542 RepID=A0A9P6VMZ0_9HELO|nr:Pantothenic acid kinase [Hyphodiscus hymeniophilus]
MSADIPQADQLPLSELRNAPPSPLTTSAKPPRMRTNTAEIDSTIIHPGSVKINVKGAFIVDQDAGSPNGSVNVNGGSHDTKDIRLPNHTAVVSHIAVDIGGSLAKLVYFSREPLSREPGGRLNFMNFETDRIDDCVEFMKELKIKQQKLNGSRPGLDFFITEIPREVFTYSETDPMHFDDPRPDIYPYLLVNIGSGVSMIKVSGPREYQRVGGTSLGGGTLWGLLALLTGARTFDEMLGMAEKGDNSKVDMLVGDIYGTDYGKIGLKSSTIASSFGKVFRMKREAEREAEDSGGLTNGDAGSSQSQSSDTQAPNGPLEESESSSAPFSSPDISRSLLYAISNNIGQIAYLQSEKHSLSTIYFGGSFIRGHRQTMNTLSYAIKFWSNGEKKAYFLRHEGYLGAVGAFLKRQPWNWGRRGSLEEGVGPGTEAWNEFRENKGEA